METPRGLLVVLLLLALGFCGDVADIWQGGAGLIIRIVLLVGRLAAIFGILQRSLTGWWLAIAFFFVIVALNAVALITLDVHPLGIALGLVFPLGSLLYLVAVRNEFE